VTTTLLVLAGLGALNPLRAAAASPDTDRARAVAVALAATTLAIGLAAWVSGPLLEAVHVTGPSARIAAGVALVAVSLRDLLGPAPAPEPALAGAGAGLIPLAFPVLFTPAVALLALAGGADRGVVTAVAALLPGLALAGAAALRPPRRGVGVGLRVIAGYAVGAGALVTLDGVYGI
jgi:small neutral amino acid transporter SnatA (MarC family)